MALFFDKNWFDQALSLAGISHASLAERLGLSDSELADMWKDQRELTEADVIGLAEILGRPMAEIALRAGVSTPNPAKAKADPLSEILHRLSRLEAEVSALRHLVRNQSPDSGEQA
jgi:transcriptional regulator with XRE-family HTH domain